MRKGFRISILLLTLIHAVLLAQSARVEPREGNQAPRQVNVCELLTDVLRLNGEMIQVRGVVENWSGYWMSDRNCNANVRSLNIKFENLIALTSPALAQKVGVHKVSFTWDQASRNRLYEASYYASVRGERIRATVVGLYETRVPVASGGYAGFGDQGIAPAQIIVNTVQDIVLEPKPDQR